MTWSNPLPPRLLRRGCPFSGLLYAGLAITSDGPAVVEFNCRFGDPETQAVLALLDSPLGAVLYATAAGTLADVAPLRWDDGYAVTVVLAAENYPGRPRFGDVITGARPTGYCMPGRRDVTTEQSSPPAGGCCRSSGPEPTSPPPEPTRIGCCRRFGCRAAISAPISDWPPRRAGSRCERSPPSRLAGSGHRYRRRPGLRRCLPR